MIGNISVLSRTEPTPTKLNQTLIERAAGGDQAAYADIYHLTASATYRLVYGMLLHHEDTEEVIQDTYSYAFRRLDQFDPQQSAFKTWLYTIAVSRTRNKRRRKWLPTIGLAAASETVASSEPGPETSLEYKLLQDAVQHALGQLSPKLREAVILRYFEGLTYREISDILDCPLKTAESRVRLAHQALYDILGESGARLIGAAYAACD